MNFGHKPIVGALVLLVVTGCMSDDRRGPSTGGNDWSLSFVRKLSNGFACDDTVYVPATSGTNTELLTLDPQTLDTASLGVTADYGYDAIGLNHRDGFIYAISNRNATPSADTTPRIVRVDHRGNIDDLGTLPILAGKEWIVGTILRDGTYVIGDFNDHDWVRLDVLSKPPRVVASGTVESFVPSAWAASPVDNKIYGYQFIEGGKLSVFDVTRTPPTFEVAANELVDTSTKQPVGPGPCSMAFTHQKLMLLYCKTDNPAVDTLYSVDVAANTATPLASKQPLGFGDMATCAFHP